MTDNKEIVEQILTDYGYNTIDESYIHAYNCSLNTAIYKDKEFTALIHNAILNNKITDQLKEFYNKHKKELYE